VIARSLGRSRQWVASWTRRYDPGDPGWASERSRAPRRVANRTSEALVAQVVAVRRRLQDDPWAQIGSEAVAWELEKLGIVPPSTRTVERILARAGLAPRPRPARREPKGVPYPAPSCERPGDLQQADLVGPRHLDGGLPFVALNAIDVCAHAAGIEIAPEQSELTITAALQALWGRLGLPRRLQLDNGKPFVLGSTKLGEIVRVCLHDNVTPVFIPQGEPWRNAVVEHFNDTFDKRFYRSERFSSREQLAGRALEFERFHNANHRYRASGRRTPNEVTAAAATRHPTPAAEIPADWPEAGRIEFIRFIRSDRKLRLLRRSISVPEGLVYRYVTATLDLALDPAEGNLLVHRDGELALRATIPRPTG
jgi:putative transposase